jgi:TRAP-type C4-dicarboxylate transport system permease small subunit
MTTKKEPAADKAASLAPASPAPALPIPASPWRPDEGERSAFRVLIDFVYLAAGYLAGFFLVVIFLLMMALSIGRFIGWNIPSGDDFVAWSMAAMAFLGLAHTFKEGEMIRVGLLVDKLGGRTKRAAEIISLTIGFVILTYFAWHATRLTIESYKFNDISQGVVPVPLWIPQIGYCTGLVLLAIAFLDELIRTLAGYRPCYEKDAPKTAEELVERAASSAV